MKTNEEGWHDTLLMNLLKERDEIARKPFEGMGADEELDDAAQVQEALEDNTWMWSNVAPGKIVKREVHTTGVKFVYSDGTKSPVYKIPNKNGE